MKNDKTDGRWVNKLWTSLAGEPLTFMTLLLAHLTPYPTAISFSLVCPIFKWVFSPWHLSFLFLKYTNKKCIVNVLSIKYRTKSYFRGNIKMYEAQFSAHGETNLPPVSNESYAANSWLFLSIAFIDISNPPFAAQHLSSVQPERIILHILSRVEWLQGIYKWCFYLLIQFQSHYHNSLPSYAYAPALVWNSGPWLPNNYKLSQVQRR